MYSAALNISPLLVHQIKSKLKCCCHMTQQHMIGYTHRGSDTPPRKTPQSGCCRWLHQWILGWSDRCCLKTMQNNI